jgi:hypothetical protein
MSLRDWWRHLLGRDRLVSDRVYGNFFCTDCQHASCDRCAIKNRQVRGCSSACSAFITREESTP